MKLPQVFIGDTQSKLWPILSTLAGLVTIITPIVALISFLLSHSTSIPSTILAVYACFLIFALLYLLILQEARYRREEARNRREEARYRRESRYGPATVPVRKAFASLADASWTLLEGDGSEESFLVHLRESLRFLAEAFSLVTNAVCRASIKMTDASAIGDAPNKTLDIEVVTLCRNTEEDEAPRLERDRIGNNTDFRQIFTENAAYFFCNNLPAQLNRGYQNSHWDQHIIETDAFDYRATIVWPIARSRRIDQRVPQERDIIGFLCVDTPATDVFNETYDVPLGAAFPQTLNLILRRFRDRKRAPQSDATNQPGSQDSDS